ncbi:cysteine desulfurase family protein [Lysinibacillus antri]|uniref:Aminotransferase class V-fold PLP-dependent enzyme n=1 Tax=Lysinibacillus antri TaxID=2498145 RepID=A0A3S0R8C6_9BACI|nr:IscS subfamily cysteine desulfurase [Lysinibacillus antri]RUL56387.1 aminotransferase class V-fold PLP-dependent enzyme [Lysinibacillus antri]
MIYLDYAATTPMTDAAIDAYSSAAKELFGNTSSLHDAGGKAHLLLEHARSVIASKMGVNRDGIYFTGSGTEGNIIAILSLARAGKGKHIITSAAEHTSVHAAMNTLEREGFEITKLSFTENGLIDLEGLTEAIREDTVLISIQHVNSEIGSIQPVEQIANIAKLHGIPYHVDCVQSFCKLPIDAFSNNVDAITISAHKVGGPKGCGAIYLNPRKRIVPVFPGVTHEKGIRGGTVDTPAIIAMTVAVEQYEYNLEKYWSLRNNLKASIKSPAIEFIEAPSESQLPSICGLCMKGVEGQFVMLSLNEENICISTGSACDINSASGTKAIMAMGYDLTKARQFFRISFGVDTTKEQIGKLGAHLTKIAID